jgi:hypothetical protein
MAATDGAPGGAAAPPAAAWQETAKPQDRSSKGRTKARQRGGLGSGARADVVAEAFLPEGTEAARYVDADASPPVLRDATHRVVFAVRAPWTLTPHFVANPSVD